MAEPHLPPEAGSPPVELLRSKNFEELELVRQLLQEAGIACRATKVKMMNDYTQLGHLDVPEDGVLTVAKADFRAARDVMEAAFAKEELPEGHFLRTASDEDILEVLAEPDDWSAFDVAHARRLAQERQLDPDQQKEVVAALKENCEKGVPAPAWLIALGWVMAFVNGGTILGLVLSIGIACRIAFWKVDRGLGDFYLYDLRCRKMGQYMLYTAIVMAAVWRLLIVMTARGF